MTTAQEAALADYLTALAAAGRPSWAETRTALDPYGRTLTLADGDLLLTRGGEGERDLDLVAGKPELAQALQVLIGTPRGSDVFNLLFGFGLAELLSQPQPLRQERELVRLSVVQALAQELRVQQIREVTFVDEPGYLVLHPELTAAEQAALATEQRHSRRWSLDVVVDTTLTDGTTGEQLVATVEGISR